MQYRVNGRNLKRDEVKAQKRAEAEARNAAYQKLSFEEKLARQTPGGKAYNKLLAKQEKLNAK